MNQNVLRFLRESGILPGYHVVLHASFRQIRDSLGYSSPEAFLDDLMHYLTPEGSLILPAFTYCFKGKEKTEVYDPLHTSAKTGILSEVFWKIPGVKRTHSPTHSFGIWGAFNNIVRSDVATESPLGWGSALSYLLGYKDSHILLMGTDFSSMSFIHFLEVYFRIEYAHIFPWEHLGIEPVGLSIAGEHRLCEVPGCSKSFTNLEIALEDDGYYILHDFNGMFYKLINVRGLLFFSTPFMQSHFKSLLCIDQECKPCSLRRKKLKEIELLNEL